MVRYTVAIGAVNTAAGGYVRLYSYYNNQWNLFGNFVAEANDSQGRSVSLSDDGMTVAMGATGNDANGSSSGMCVSTNGMALVLGIS